jgi:hypothetical protein
VPTSGCRPPAALEASDPAASGRLGAITRRPTTRRSAALLVVAGLITACSGGSDGSDRSDAASPDDETAQAEAGPPTPEEFDGGDFYAAPDPVPDDEHGTLVRYQPVDGLDVGGATAWRIMHVSESLEGERIVVTGTALVPAGEAPTGGLRC